MFGEARFPIRDRTRWDRETRTDYLAGSAGPATRTRPRKKGDGRSRPSGPIAKLKMIGRWIVKVDGALGQAQAEDLGVKIHVALRIARDGSDMMNSAKFHNRTEG